MWVLHVLRRPAFAVLLVETNRSLISSSADHCVRCLTTRPNNTLHLSDLCGVWRARPGRSRLFREATRAGGLLFTRSVSERGTLGRHGRVDA